jgi:co-chaperonin GroES (HSP10)
MAASEILSGQMSNFDGSLNHWVTDETVPDPNPLPVVTGWNLLIRPVDPGKKIKTKSGGTLYLPDEFVSDMQYLTNVGQVKAMGPLCYRDPNVKPVDGAYYPHGRYTGPWCKVGDYVVWGKHQGTKMKIKGVSFVLLQDELVLMTLENPTDINPMFAV